MLVSMTIPSDFINTTRLPPMQESNFQTHPLKVWTVRKIHPFKSLFWAVDTKEKGELSSEQDVKVKS